MFKDSFDVENLLKITSDKNQCKVIAFRTTNSGDNYLYTSRFSWNKYNSVGTRGLVIYFTIHASNSSPWPNTADSEWRLLLNVDSYGGAYLYKIGNF